MDLFLAPHNDDETLFGAYTILRQRPLVAICFRSDKQKAMGISYQTRERETEAALRELGDPDHAQNDTLDTDPRPSSGILEFFEDILQTITRSEIERVYAPAVEDGGHEQHNLVGMLAKGYFGDKVQPYLTYRRGSMRSHGREVEPQPGDVAAKMRALACYSSQIELPATRPWFVDDTLREYMP